MLKKSLLCALLSASFTFAMVTAEETRPVEEKIEPEIDIKKLSEAFGNFIGKNIKSSGLNLDVASLIQGIQDGSAGKPSPMNEKEYEKGMIALQQKTLKKLADDNLKAANTFLEENSKKPNVVVLEPGKLQYLILQPGSGEAIKEHGTSVIKYKGSYIDGTVFGNSDDAGGSITLPIDQTIPGFSKALVGMKEGEKRQIFVHPDLGYETKGPLPPNSLLIFEVEVIKAEAPQPADNKASQNEDDDETPIAELDVNVKNVKPQSADTPKGDENDEDENDDNDEDEDEDDDYEDEDDEDNDEDDKDVIAPKNPLK